MIQISTHIPQSGDSPVQCAPEVISSETHLETLGLLTTTLVIGEVDRYISLCNALCPDSDEPLTYAHLIDLNSVADLFEMLANGTRRMSKSLNRACLSDLPKGTDSSRLRVNESLNEVVSAYKESYMERSHTEDEPA